MQVTLLEPAERNGDRVHFTAEGGCGIALWRGSGPQAAGVPIDIEMQVQEEIAWDDIAFSQQAGPMVSVLGHSMNINGIVEGVDKDGVLVLRWGNGIVLLDTTGEPPVGVVGQEVTVTVRDAEIYPTAI